MASQKEITLYTCIVNYRSSPKIIEYRDDINYVLFSNDHVDVPGWNVRPLVWQDQDPVRTARYHKHHPFMLFPESEYTIWLDATHYPYKSVLPLITDKELSVMKHFSRNTIKAEAEACISGNLDNSSLIKEQLNQYAKDKFLDDQGLYSTACLVRKNTQSLNDFQKFWWDQICSWSRRDQISLPYCLWKKEISFGIIPGVCRMGYNPTFKMISHYKKFNRFL